MGKEILAAEYSCNNYFFNESLEKRTKAFTRLWTSIINQKENSDIAVFHEGTVLQTKISGV